MVKQVLIVVPTDHLGGAEQLQKKAAQQLVKKNYKVTILFFTRPDSLGWNDISGIDSVELVFSKSKSTLKGLAFVLKYLFRNRSKCYEYIISSQVFVTGIIGFLIRIKLLKKHYFIGRESTTIFSRFSGIKLFLYKIQYYIGYSSLDLLICQTSKMKEELLSSLPWLEDKTMVKVINNPIDLQEANFLSNNPLDTKKYGDYLVSAGRLIPEKGFDILIEAFAKISNDYQSLNLVILGKGDEKSHLLKQANILGIKDKVFFPGFVENVYPYLKSAKACVVSSRIEGFPNILLQMMTQNDKVVSTLCAGDIDNIEGVIIAEPNSVNSLKSAIYEVLKKDSTRIRKSFEDELFTRSFDSYFSRIKGLLS